jgi:hypothetical protein
MAVWYRTARRLSVAKVVRSERGPHTCISGCRYLRLWRIIAELLQALCGVRIIFLRICHRDILKHKDRHMKVRISEYLQFEILAIENLCTHREAARFLPSRVRDLVADSVGPFSSGPALAAFQPLGNSV